MTTARQPWHVNDRNLCDADGRPFALFLDPRDADLVVANQEAAGKLDELEGKLKAIEDALKGEF